MAKPPKSTSYEVQRKYWYKKLADKGFVDIEKSILRFHDGTAQFRRERSTRSWQAKQAYYIMAEHFLNDHNFNSKLERVIWEYHANGISMRDIVQLLMKVNIKDKKKDTILAIIKDLRKIMINRYMNAKLVYE